MKKILTLAFAILLLAMPIAAEAQQQKKKQQNEENPLVLIIGIFSALNCIFTCGGTTKTIVTTTILQQ